MAIKGQQRACLPTWECGSGMGEKLFSYSLVFRTFCDQERCWSLRCCEQQALHQLLRPPLLPFSLSEASPYVSGSRRLSRGRGAAAAGPPRSLGSAGGAAFLPAPAVSQEPARSVTARPRRHARPRRSRWRRPVPPGGGQGRTAPRRASAEL